MSFQPRTQSERILPLVVEREVSPASGVFEIADRLTVREVRLGRNAALSTAQLDVRLDGAFTTADALAAFAGGERVRVRTDEATPERRTVLFEGWLPRTESAWEATAAGQTARCSVTAEHTAGQWALASLVTGRVMRSIHSEKMLAAAAAGNETAVERAGGLPCVFNLEGTPNCATSPTAIVDATGNLRQVYVFSGDCDPMAAPWTFARAIRYVAWFHRGGGASAGISSLLAVTETPAAVGPSVSSLPNALNTVEALLARPVSGVSCEGMNAVEAILTLARAAGVHVCIEPTQVGDRWETAWRFFAADAAPKRLRLRGAAAGASAARLLVDNNVSAARISRDVRRIVHRTTVVGGVPTVELTLPLVPGWKPIEGVDDVAAMDRSSAKSMALTPADVFARRDEAADDSWFQRFHRAGAQHARFASVGRRWVLNEDGRYDGETFARNAPFDDYAPFDFSTLLNDDPAATMFVVRRARRLLPAVSTTQESAPIGVWVEVSYDSGATWHCYCGAVRVARDECAIEFDCANPAGIAPPGVDPREQNLWYALVDQMFRVRVTASVETDDRMATGRNVDATWRGAAWHRRAWRLEGESFQRNLIAESSSALATMGAPALLLRDDAAALEHAETAAAALGVDNATIGGPRVPWVDLEYRIGDRMDGIDGWGASFADGGGSHRSTPVVAGKVFRLSGGRYETELLLSGA